MTVTRNRERSPCCKLSAIFSMSSSVSALISALVNPKDERSSRLTDNTSYLRFQASESISASSCPVVRINTCLFFDKHLCYKADKAPILGALRCISPWMDIVVVTPGTQRNKKSVRVNLLVFKDMGRMQIENVNFTLSIEGKTPMSHTASQ